MLSSCLRGRSSTRWLTGVLCRYGEFTPGQNEAGPESIRQDLKQSAPLNAHSIHPPETLCERIYHTCGNGVLKVIAEPQHQRKIPVAISLQCRGDEPGPS